MTTFSAKLVTEKSITVIIDGVAYTATNSNFNYQELREACKNDDVDKFLKLYNATNEAIESLVLKSGGRAVVTNDVIYYDGKPLNNDMTKRMLDLARAGEDIDYLLKFIENLMKNPSKHSIDQAYNFLCQENLPITKDGCFLCYKTVRNDFFDKYSGTINNAVGQVVEVPRNSVDDNPNKHCSAGIHVGGLTYSGPGGWYNSPEDQVIICKVNPADIVSVPNDHNFTKMRVCKYIVIGLYKGELNRPVYSGATVQDSNYDSDEYSTDDSWGVQEDDDAMEFDDLVEFDTITFDYTKDKVTEKRYCEIESIHYDGDTEDAYIIGKLMSPENDAGDYRRFNADKMFGIKLV